PVSSFSPNTATHVVATPAARSARRPRLGGSNCQTSTAASASETPWPYCCRASSSRQKSPRRLSPPAHAATRPSSGKASSASPNSPGIHRRVVRAVESGSKRGSPAMSVHPSDHTRPDPGRTPAGRTLAGLLAALLAVYVPGLFSLPVVDRDEARFAQASRQMLESVVLGPEAGDRRPIRREDGVLTGGAHAGSWAVPMLGDRPRLAKPPLAYWAQAASAGILTWGNPQADRVWHYRAPSVL